jgi:hypothetical protein
MKTTTMNNKPMKRYLIILALCGSAYARDYYYDDIDDLERQFKKLAKQQEELAREQEAQVKKIADQQEEILRRQRQAEIDASRVRREAEEAAENARLDMQARAEINACRSVEEMMIVAETHRQQALARLDFQLKQMEAVKPQQKVVQKQQEPQYLRQAQEQAQRMARAVQERAQQYRNEHK